MLVDDQGREHVVWPSEGAYSNNAACVGGGTFSYGAMAWRYMEKDFRMRSTYGAVAGSTLDDWPISYDDLEPYYEKAEWEIGVSGDDSGQSFQSAAPQAAAHAAAAAQARARDPASPPPSAWGCTRSTSPCCATPCPTTAGAACMRCRWCVGFACEVNAKYGTHNTVIPTRPGHRQLRTAHGVHGARRS